jgi:hypothetical protein
MWATSPSAAFFIAHPMAIIRCLIAWLRCSSTIASRAANIGPSDLTQSKIEAQRLRSQQIALQLARDKGELISINLVETFVKDSSDAIFAEFGGLAAAITRDLELRAIIDKEVDGCVGRFRDRCARNIKALASGKSIIVDEESDDD